MISRARRILFAFLIISVVVMSAILIRLRERARDRLRFVPESSPLVESAPSTPQTIKLVVPNDLDGSLQEMQRSQSLPADNSTKARVLLETLLESFHDPHSTHPIAVKAVGDSTEIAQGASSDVEDVFLMPVPQRPGSSKSSGANAGTLAVVDLSAAFAASHPSGIEPETLTLLSILRTLHDNMPEIAQVHFLIDGHPAETLAGHADLTRTYLTAETITGTQQP
jgi:hypothetical protein